MHKTKASTLTLRPGGLVHGEAGDGAEQAEGLALDGVHGVGDGGARHGVAVHVQAGGVPARAGPGEHKWTEYQYVA